LTGLINRAPFIDLLKKNINTAEHKKHIVILRCIKQKKIKKNSFQFYNKEHTNELLMDQSLINAIENDEFSLHYQPIVNNEGECMFLEALCRWNNPDFGCVSPEVLFQIRKEQGHY